MFQTNQQMVQYLIDIGVLKTSGIIRAFQKIDRRDFVPKTLKNDAYLDMPLPIGEGQTISQPQTVAIMLEALGPGFGDKVLDIGSGSGWQTALLAEIVGIKGLVIGIEYLEGLCQQGFQNIEKYFPKINFLQNQQEPLSSKVRKGVVVIVCGDGRLGFPQAAPYEKIIAAAAASDPEDLPGAWKDQLKTGGRLVAPVGQSLIILDKQGPAEFEQKVLHGFIFVPLK
jgi:protein-L-isoaspartate(D-aspartate) O-methyltransferase